MDIWKEVSDSEELTLGKIIDGGRNFGLILDECGRL